MPNSPLSVLSRLRLLPIITVDDPAHTGPLADALVAGGLPCVELTLRTPTALESVKRLAARGDLLVGAGTIRTVDQAKAATDAGASFLVSPSCRPDVLKWCAGANVPITPGCITPTEIEVAVEHGFSTVKFFPASNFGGATTIKAYAGPLPDVKFIPTGGITQATLGEYLALKNVVACGGGWFATADDLKSGKFDLIRARAAEAVALVGAKA